MTIAGLVPVSLVDYPGHVAVTLFTAGCDLRCPFCHNPDLVASRPQAPVAVADVLDLLRRRPAVTHVCVSGGEPTLHRDLPQLVDAVKSLGRKVKLDTCGSRPERLAQVLRAGLCDYVAMDIKTSWDRYLELGPVPGSTCARAAEWVRTLAPDYEFRTTVYPGVVDHAAVRSIAASIAGARRYALQQFVAGPRLLDAQAAAVAPYRAAVLEDWARELSPLFAEPVQVRNTGLGTAAPA